MNNLPGINYDTKLDTDDLKIQANEVEAQLLSRTRLSMGEGAVSDLAYGIVDNINPQDLVGTDTGRPLLVRPSDVNSLRIDISAGTAVCPNGSIVVLGADITNYELARSNDDDINIVYLENEIIPDGDYRVSRYNTSAQVRRVQSPNKLRVTLLSDYNNQSLFPNDRKKNIVVIAVIRVASGSLIIDYTSNEYSFNRPWFSILDSQHRAQIGSGAVTERNPHGLTFNDLSTGSIPFYYQVESTGLVLAKDKDLKGKPGYACVEKIDSTRIQTDSTGNLTSLSRFGGIGARYIELANYPISVSSFHLEDHKSRSIAFDHIKGTRYIVLPASDVFTESALIYYNRVSAMEIPSFVNGNKIEFTQPDPDNEVLISGGLSFPSVANNVMDFEGSGPVAREYQVFLSPSGDLLKFPQIIQNTLLMDSIGPDYITVSATQFGPSQISVALIDAVPSANMKVTIRIFGTNAQDASITEDIVFDSEWVSSALPANENLDNLRKTDTIFNSVTGFQIIERNLDGAASKFVIFAELESGVATSLNSLCKLADVSWDGLSIGEVKDSRKILPFLPGGYNHRYKAVADIYQSNLVLSEDYSTPQFVEVIPGYEEATSASTYLTFSANVSAGDTVQLSDTRTIVAVNTSPNRILGEFQIGVDEVETRNDAVLTINNGSFNSGYTATADGTNRIKLVANTTGARGNSDITIITTISQAITKDGNVSGGYDGFGEVVVPHHSTDLSSPIPSPSLYEVYNLRGRYLSRAIPIDNKMTLVAFIHGLGLPYPANIQVRTRVSYGSLEWQPWEIQTSLNQRFELSFTSAITKIQIEIFGRCGGFSLYEG